MSEITREKQLEDLDSYLIKSENLFFESSFVHSLKPEHRKTLLIALKLFCPGKDITGNSYRHYIYNFIAEWFQFTAGEMLEHCEKHPIDTLFDIFNDLPANSKIGVTLLLNCILYIDNNATEQQKLLAKSIITLMGITPEIYLRIMDKIGAVNRDKWFSYIHNHSF